ncbi:MAG: acetamidase/formamidase family protein [Clostridia bacterium]
MTSRLVQTTAMSWILDPSEEMLGPVADGGTIVARTSPGCWGPMITPDYASGHEVTRPIAVEGVEVGDAVALEIRRVRITSTATTSGTDSPVEGSFVDDPFVAPKCPGCGKVNPETYIEGTGPDAVRCRDCDTPVASFRLVNGYTMMFDEDHSVGVTVSEEVAEEIARAPSAFSALPRESLQYSTNLLAKADMPGIVSPVRPMVGNIGSCPSVPIPSSHNAGDFGGFLVGAGHDYALTEEQLEGRTDGHMDVNDVTEGSLLIVPAKVEGAGIYVGDVHAMQGDGEIAGHTTDVSAEVTLGVEVLSGLRLEGPLLLARPEAVPPEARPLSEGERDRARHLSQRLGFTLEEPTLPVGFIGSGATINEATDCALRRMAALTGYEFDEVRNRCTIRGAIEIGRLPGIAVATAALPYDRLEAMGLLDIVRRHYGGSEETS